MFLWRGRDLCTAETGEWDRLVDGMWHLTSAKHSGNPAVWQYLEERYQSQSGSEGS